MMDDDVYYYISERLKLEGETENMSVCTKKRKGVSAEVLMATPCTNSHIGVALKLRSLHFTHPVYVASRYFQ